MPPRERLTRKESKEQTRAEVLRAARRLFLRDGFVATSLSAIAEEAAVTKGAVYSNFESKEDLFLSIVREEQLRGTSARNELSINRWEEISDSPDASDALAAMGRNVHANLPSHRQVALFLEYNVFALRNQRSREWVADHNGDYFEKSAAVIEELRGTDGEDVAKIAQSLFVGLLLHHALDPERFDEDLFARAFGALADLLDRTP